MESVPTVDAPQGLELPNTVQLDPKNRRTLLAAIDAKAGYLLTGDAARFNHFYGKRIEGVLVQTPAQYFERLRRY